jgi:hypothetical protein
MPSRYEGKPFLRLLELYVLWAIEELGEEDAATLEQMTPELRQSYNREGAWQEITAAEMDFPESIVRQIVQIWENNRALAKGNGENLEPEHFAQMFVDQNFA